MNLSTVFFVIFAIWALSGCANVPGDTLPPQIIYKPVETKVPVRVPCVAKDQVPEEPAYAMNDPMLAKKGLHERSLSALKEIEQRREWQRKAKALLDSCVSSSG